MNISSQFHKQAEGLRSSEWAIGIYSESLDTRGAEAVKYLKRTCKVTIQISYDPDNFTFLWNGISVGVDDLDSYFDGIDLSGALVDATTCSFSELLLVVKQLHRATKKFEILYLEPKEYRKKTNSNYPRKREFEITEEIPGYKAIPRFSTLLTEEAAHHVVFLVGYEASRLDRAMEDYQMIDPANCSVVFGVPAFKPGWEVDSFSNNLPVIKHRKLHRDMKYCGATNAQAIYEILVEVNTSLDINCRLVVAPIGTKPMGIGAALFLCDYSESALIYDHPINSKMRTTEISMWHMFSIEFV